MEEDLFDREIGRDDDVGEVDDLDIGDDEIDDEGEDEEEDE